MGTIEKHRRSRRFGRILIKIKKSSPEAEISKELLPISALKISESASIEQPFQHSVPKEAAIKINTEPTIIELAGVISQEKTVGPVSEFIFRMPDGEEVGRVKNIDEFITLLVRAPLKSILYHVNKEHFYLWLGLIGYEKLAEMVKDIKGETEEVRNKLLQAFIQMQTNEI